MKSVALTFSVISLLLVAPACKPSPHMLAELTVRVGEPREPDSGFELLSVAEDLTARIRLDTGEVLSGRPGHYFAGPMHGAHRPQLRSASYKKQEATFRWIMH